jgi:hypothetical protein
MVTRLPKLALATAIALLAGCRDYPDTNVACQSLNKGDVEAAIPGTPFRAGAGSFSQDSDEEYANASCVFETVSETPWMVVDLDLYDGKPQPMTIARLRAGFTNDKRVDIHEVPGFGDLAFWSATPPGPHYLKAYHFDVLKGGNRYAYLSIVGVRDEQAEPVLEKLAAIAIERFEKIRGSAAKK